MVDKAAAIKHPRSDQDMPELVYIPKVPSTQLLPSLRPTWPRGYQTSLYLLQFPHLDNVQYSSETEASPHEQFLGPSKRYHPLED